MKFPKHTLPALCGSFVLYEIPDHGTNLISRQRISGLLADPVHIIDQSPSSLS